MEEVGLGGGQVGPRGGRAWRGSGLEGFRLDRGRGGGGTPEQPCYSRVGRNDPKIIPKPALLRCQHKNEI